MVCPNLGVLEEYRQKMREHATVAADLEQATNARDEAKREYERLKRERLEIFLEGFSFISSKLKEMYQLITIEGNAELELVDSLDPFSEGVLFSVMPPKKSWKSITNLSGGEKVSFGYSKQNKRRIHFFNFPPVFPAASTLADTVFTCTGLCSASVQAHSCVCDGRDRRGAGFPQRLDHWALYSRAHPRLGAVHYYQPA
jgi:hypothetical protein